MEKSVEDWKVLVADNSAVMGRLIKKYLVDLGLKGENITLAGDGNQASMITELMPFDLVTAGRHMKNKDGLELLQDIRGHNNEQVRGVKYLMISADGSPQLMADILSAGANGLLTKPFHPEDLQETLNRLGALTNGGFVCLNDNERQAAKSGGAEEADEAGADGQVVPEGLVRVFVKCAVEGLGQYMVMATPGSHKEAGEPGGDLLSSIEITDEKLGIGMTLSLLFPKQAACTIYETLFGEVDTEMVCGIVGELNNIIAGAVKPMLAGMETACHQFLFPGKEPLAPGAEFRLQLGFPECRWLSAGEKAGEAGGAPDFTVPFELDQGRLYLSLKLHPV